MKKLSIILIAVSVCLGVSAQIYNNFMQAGKTAYRDRNYRLATYFYDEALRQIPADSIYDIYECNVYMMNSYKGMKDYPAAIRYGKNAIGNVEQLGLTGTYSMLEDSLLVANLYALDGDSLAASRYLDGVFGNALNLKLSWKGKQKLAALGGMISSRQGNWRQAESMYDLSRQIMGKFSPCDETVTTLNLYGNAAYHNDRYDEALKAYQEQLKVCQQLYGVNSREYHWAQYCIANILAYLGRIDEGAAIYKDVIAWYRDRMLNDLQFVPSTERDRYLDNMIDILQNAIPFGIEAKYDQDEFTAMAYECLLQTKGLLLATEESTEAIIREQGKPEEVAALDSLWKLKTRLNDLLADAGSDAKDILNTYAGIKTIDVQLANACTAYGSNTAFLVIGYDQVRNALSDGEVLLDFTDFKPKGKPRQYVCFEIRKNQRYPKVHHICTGAQLDSLLALENHRWGNLYNGESGRDMATLIGEPLKRMIRGAKAVYYVPSGIFHKLAIEAIPDGEACLGDNHEFRRLSSGRELAAAHSAGIGDNARLYGGLKYGEDVMNLAQSLNEVTEIEATLASNVNAATLTGNDGTKESVLSLSGKSPSVIHFSTHGFYYTPDDRNKPLSLQGYDDAMSLSGLVMSGGSLKSRQGLLTAAEVAGCSLEDTRIACLASCHSGQGEVTSEGIYGLQRAFKKAGVESVIMNLWEASDVASKCFMTNFYADLVNGSKDRRKAFRFARNEVRKKFPSPFYWAGFVMVD